MKKIFLVLFLMSTLSSCEKWFDIQPKTEIKLDKLFNTETGFKNALIGSYLLMADPGLYGRTMNITFMDVVAQQYEMKAGNDLYVAKIYNYADDDCKKIIDGIWGKSYKIIANLNAIIGEIDTRKNVLHPTSYGYVKGEALGLRAFLHFDLLRMFGPGGLEVRKNHLNTLSIPYVTMYDKGITKQSTVEQVLQLIEEDLLQAERLLEYYDIYDVVSKDPNFERPSDLFFTSNRKSRFNYLAVKATQARLYLWWGKYDKALEATKEFTRTENVRISWVSMEKDIDAPLIERDFKITREKIFQLDVFKFYENIKKYNEFYKISVEGSFSSSDNDQYFYHSILTADQLYESSTIGTADFRYTKFYDRDLADFTFLKFREIEGSKSTGIGKMGLMKKSEMYYIAAECHMKAGNIPEAVRLLNEVRVNRGIKYENNLPATLSVDQVKTEIEKEYRKEFIGEGVMFFFYKRLHEAIPGSLRSAEDAVFIFPLPAVEVEVGNRIEIVESN